MKRHAMSLRPRMVAIEVALVASSSLIGRDHQLLARDLSRRCSSERLDLRYGWTEQMLPGRQSCTYVTTGWNIWRAD